MSTTESAWPAHPSKLPEGCQTAPGHAQIHPSRPLAARGIDYPAGVRLVGSALDLNPPAPPGVVQVSLLWEALRAPLPDCTVHLRLIDANGRVVARRDKPPLAGAYPTHFWDPGDRVGDSVAIPIPANLPAGTYRIEVGLYLPATGARLATPNGTSVIVGTIRVR